MKSELWADPLRNNSPHTQYHPDQRPEVGCKLWTYQNPFIAEISCAKADHITKSKGPEGWGLPMPQCPKYIKQSYSIPLCWCLNVKHLPNKPLKSRKKLPHYSMVCPCCTGPVLLGARHPQHHRIHGFQVGGVRCQGQLHLQVPTWAASRSWSPSLHTIATDHCRSQKEGWGQVGIGQSPKDCCETGAGTPGWPVFMVIFNS